MSNGLVLFDLIRSVVRPTFIIIPTSSIAISAFVVVVVAEAICVV